MSERGELETASDDAGAELLLFADEFGLIVQGPEDVARAAIDRLLDGSDPGPGARRSLGKADVAAVAASGLAVSAASGEYLRLTAESAAKVAQYGAELDNGGALRGWVKDGNAFAGQLVFQPVSLAAEQALAIQTAAVSIALRSAIADVQKAVERVEGKVDQIKQHLDNRLRGDVIGTYRHLERVAAATNARGRLLQADWDGVAGIQNQLLRDLETLRTHVTHAAEKLTNRQRLPKREDMIRDFGARRGDVGDMLRLILVAEQALHLWEYLRLQQVAARESDQLSSAIEDARQSLRQERELDASMVETLRASLEQARVIEPLEYRHLITKNALLRDASAFDDLLREFAASARLRELEVLAELTQPRFVDARDEVGRRASEAGKAVKVLGAAAAKGGSQAAARGGRRLGQAIRRRSPEEDE
ncbi:hypothetical protein KV100_03090 [Mumia sp. zg.B21]|uniref:hypothetical protein n=1 Tax=Mumia sp. zg.B21 TaxID=2855447 RepID=UPI001C6E94D4|nr:hypothetical protein [Mumia sp. zg.B21]MBW9208626.1 hypothetical protein [Mumia sp. zg.B21]